MNTTNVYLGDIAGLKGGLDETASVPPQPDPFPHRLNDDMMVGLLRAAYVKGFMQALDSTGKDKLVNMIMAHQGAKNIKSPTDVPALMDPWTDEQIEEAHRLVHGKDTP